MIYFIECQNKIKIGYTGDINPNKRIKSLQTGNPFSLKLLGTIPGSQNEERWLHNKFERYREQGEWFSASVELVGEVSKLLGGDNSIFPQKSNVISVAFGKINCFDCGEATDRKTGNQKYCPKCRDRRNDLRWGGPNPPLPDQWFSGVELDGLIQQLEFLRKSPGCQKHCTERALDFISYIYRGAVEWRRRGLKYRLSGSQMNWLNALTKNWSNYLFNDLEGWLGEFEGSIRNGHPIHKDDWMLWGALEKAVPCGFC